MLYRPRLALLVAAALLSACASQSGTTTASSTSGGKTAATNSGKGAAQQTAQQADPASPGGRKVMSKDGTFEGEIVGTPAKKSKFGKLQIGMSQRQVEDLIGNPSDTKTYTTGKAWVPFYFGKDAYRFETFYKKEGRLTFVGGGISGTSGKLLRITVDTKEDGYQ
ncbi:outer membrane protein assembly factor BamE [Jeongeupia naejangsanensis]|uniref:Outer membrane protein assembly factor BamE n=1 Tax=Jeongeupia naejangsanensis TaxID=613195 RepID=A0ABS2BPW5_9NEIS|nr:outer membrane protein assembly factor BamE [Jeongeupia naejangsanensis]MBM3117068.1 outer membrane protein assembly factor BamE [Jeongeupia naejangsanensis]